MATVALIGRPNVGKSSLFNRMAGQRISIEAREAGTTRDRLYAAVTHRNITFTLVDAAGVAETNLELEKLANEQVWNAGKEADLILFVVDAQEGLLPADQIIAEKLRKLGKPVIVVANKTDNRSTQNQIFEFNKFGFLAVMPTSAIHNSGIEDVLNEIIKHIKSDKVKQPANMVNVAIIGRPNVGKSTLLNQFAGEERALVSEIAGTTRDTVDITVPYKELQFKFVDTAGIRRRGKIEVGIEKFAVLRAVNAVSTSDVAILLVDAIEGPTSGDEHIVSVVLEYYAGLIIVVNKWDQYLSEFAGKSDDELQRQYLAKLHPHFEFVPWAPVVFASGLTGTNVRKIMEQVWKIWRTRNIQLDQTSLDDIAKEAAANHPHLPLIYSISQSGINPPRFKVIVNKPDTWHFSESRYLENMIRKFEPFAGTPIKVELMAKTKK